MSLKKPKFWDYKKPNFYAYLLFPITFLIKILKSINLKTKANKFKIKTICVGNIYIGGTGKTSLSIKVKKLLDQKNIKTCFIKKYYKNQIDEQNLLKANGKLFVSKKRVYATKQAEKENFEVAIYDDGLQDQTINYDLKFICFNNINWIGNGMSIPAGPLREDISNLKKYNDVFLNGNLENLEYLKEQIIKINPNINIHLGKYRPTNLHEFNLEDTFLAFSGIGNHDTFISMLKKYGIKVIKHIEFADHYKYTDKDIIKILDQAKNLKCKIITTEKDYIRLMHKKINDIKFIKSEIEILDEDNLIKSIL